MKSEKRFINSSILILMILLVVSVGIITTVLEAASTDPGQDAAKAIFYVH